MNVSFRSALASGVALVAVTAASSAMAGGFALREQSALGMGDAFAGAAAGGAGLGSMFWNPATITNFQGKNSSWNVSGILPYANTQASAATSYGLNSNSGNIGQAAILPASYSSMQISERWWFGVASNTPFGLTTKNPRPWSGQTYGLTSKVATYEISPTIGYKVNDFLSLGLAYRLMYTDIRLTQALALAPGAPVARLLGDGLSSGFSVGATLKPGPNTEVGIGYRSRVEPRLEGRLEPTATPIIANMTMPDQVTVGVRHRVSQDLTVLAGLEWTHWRLFNRFPVVTPGGAPVTTLAFGWRDGWYASVGAEYKFNPALTLRAGLGYESSPITNQTRAVRLPDTNRIWTTAGLSYQFNQKISIDASYAHIFGRNGEINLLPGNPSFVPPPNGVPFIGRVRAHVDIVSVGVNYRWDDPAPAVVAKY